MAIDPIRVDGLRELNKSLRKMDADLPKQLRLVLNAAADIVVNDARPRIPTGPGAGGHVVSSLKSSSTRTEARVAFGSKRFPYAAWLDFGGKVGRKRSVSRPFLKQGRYLWKSYADNDQKVADKLEEGITALVREAGLS